MEHAPRLLNWRGRIPTVLGGAEISRLAFRSILLATIESRGLHTGVQRVRSCVPPAAVTASCDRGCLTRCIVRSCECLRECNPLRLSLRRWYLGFAVACCCRVRHGNGGSVLQYSPAPGPSRPSLVCTRAGDGAWRMWPRTRSAERGSWQGWARRPHAAWSRLHAAGGLDAAHASWARAERGRGGRGRTGPSFHGL